MKMTFFKIDNSLNMLKLNLYCQNSDPHQLIKKTHTKWYQKSDDAILEIKPEEDIFFFNYSIIWIISRVLKIWLNGYMINESNFMTKHNHSYDVLKWRKTRKIQ